MKKSVFLLKVIGICFLVIWLSVEGWALKQFLTAPISSLTQAKVIDIPKGASSKAVAQLLYSERLVRHPSWLRWYFRLTGNAHKIQTGEFEIHPNWTVEQLMEQLTKGKNVAYPMTFIAGETFAQSIEKLSAMPKMQHTDLTPAALQVALGVKGSLEGMILPETYFYVAGDTDLSVLKRAHEDLQAILEKEWQARSADLPFKTPYQALILASIVEKETGYAPERAKIAAVFINRLKKRMRLQSDPTIIYGMGSRYDGDIRKKDLLTKTPYNTYRINGLPPTPIALASADAIRAVFHPAQTKALYFVANGDGQHRFSNTLAEHNRAVREYLIKEKEVAKPTGSK
ncbi:endolytic transglycosylase MltG [Hydrogenovibrio sp. JE_KL2]|uniref:endolytic transglycosylase MltG n=1 Tax=Hydrogenovibrio sp. JE_KL2 TaxID=2651188 RepID=UPI00128BAA0B|nr:endolytic transglycosylase MltG [Hydrogenovibrio sp. JE_KL2]MPQ77060.1 endolytic transglycosylase MltG [Hydrogenovibrio sp. JE_KL2]